MFTLHTIFHTPPLRDPVVSVVKQYSRNAYYYLQLFRLFNSPVMAAIRFGLAENVTEEVLVAAILELVLVAAIPELVLVAAILGDVLVAAI